MNQRATQIRLFEAPSPMPKVNKPRATPVLERKYWDARLHEMLRWRRPHGSQVEIEWANRFIVEPYNAWPLMDDNNEVLAHVVIVNHADGKVPSTMFSSHVDTVHRTEGRQKITFNIADNHYGKNDGMPLGADCAAGVWLMLEMIDRKVPGAYFFHRGEESGGIGSDGIAALYRNVIGQFNKAIAFDRKGTWSVITHQWRGRCCSDEFGHALAEAINAHDTEFMYTIDDTGLFTDTANYVNDIGECTNISVGYFSEHTDKERLSLAHLFSLRDALVRIDWEALPCKRKPGEMDPDDIDVRFDFKAGPMYNPDELEAYDLYRMTRKEMEDLVYQDPELFVDLVRYEVQREVPAWAEKDEDPNDWTRYRGA